MLIITVSVQLYLIPVVHTRALDHAGCQPESERLDQMQRRTGRKTGAADITGVSRDLRFQQYDVKHLTFAQRAAF